jgi:hypothetical protein
MPSIRHITRVIDRSTQGTTRPYLCECDDGNTYFVKGIADGYSGHIAEWIAGTLGRQFGLPIPEFCQVEVDEELVASDLSGQLADLGAGIRFGSRLVEHAVEFHPRMSGLVPPELRAKILLWDHWIANGDRWAEGRKRNANLLWTNHDRGIYVFDHNLAFDRDGANCRSRHIFKEDVFNWTLDFRMDMLERMNLTLQGLDLAWDAMPTEWQDGFGSVTKAVVTQTLTRINFNASHFWQL